MARFKDSKGISLSTGDLVLITPIPNYDGEYIKGVFISYEKKRLRYYPLSEFGINTIKQENDVPGVDYFSKREFVVIEPSSRQVMRIDTAFIEEHEKAGYDEIMSYL